MNICMVACIFIQNGILVVIITRPFYNDNHARAKNNSMLAEKIIHVVENPKLRRAFGRKCVHIIKKRATWEDCVSRMQAIYERFART